MYGIIFLTTKSWSQKTLSKTNSVVLVLYEKELHAVRLAVIKKIKSPNCAEQQWPYLFQLLVDSEGTILRNLKVRS